MKTINLFIACSPTSDVLNEQKEALVKLCREMNTELASVGKGFYIKPIAYENPERRIRVFKEHIRHDDIVIVLVDNRRDEVLVDELDETLKRQKIYNKPEVFVFASNEIEKNKIYYDEIKRICADGGWLYELIQNTNILLDSVKEKIYRFVRSYKSIRILQIKSKLKHFWWIPTLILIGISLIIGHILIETQEALEKAETKRLLIVGGGSARNFIEESLLKQKNGLSTEYWLYAPMPSGDAYRMLTEEIINSNNDYKNHPYYPIVVSAGKAPDSSAFLKQIFTGKKFKEKGIVLGIYLGVDPLVVYGHNSIIDDTGFILPTQLDRLIENSDITIWATSMNSGTLKAYMEECEKITKDTKLSFFSDIDTIQLKDNWIALGSQYYHPKYDNNSTNQAVVYNTNHERITKPVYVYFMLYEDNGLYRLPNATEGFLTAIGVEKIDKILSVNDSVCKNRILYDNFELKFLKKDKNE